MSYKFQINVFIYLLQYSFVHSMLATAVEAEKAEHPKPLLHKIILCCEDMMRALKEVHPPPFSTEDEQAGPTCYSTLDGDPPLPRTESYTQNEQHEMPPPNTFVGLMSQYEHMPEPPQQDTMSGHMPEPPQQDTISRHMPQHFSQFSSYRPTHSFANLASSFNIFASYPSTFGMTVNTPAHHQTAMEDNRPTISVGNGDNDDCNSDDQPDEQGGVRTRGGGVRTRCGGVRTRGGRTQQQPQRGRPQRNRRRGTSSHH
jgi:hypothetical protein